MMKRKYYSKVTNVAQLVNDRSFNDIEHILQSRLQTAPQFIDKLELETVLKGHNGCVNCLEWSDDGRILASCSDDYHVMLWDPFRHKRLQSIQTPHQGNIFSVKFLPKTNNSRLVTGAGDARLYIFDVNQENHIWKCQCHGIRVKRLATAPETPHVFWSAAEDGIVLQFDLRTNHKCRSNEDIVFLNMKNHIQAAPEVKCIAVNPRRPELVAIGANDCYTRLYDRRMMKLATMNSTNQEVIGRSISSIDNIPHKGCVTYFSPGHLVKSKDQQPTSILVNNKAVTYVAFSPDGTELLVNMGTEQIYLYDINNSRRPTFLNLPKFENTNGFKNGEKDRHKLPLDIENMKKIGNRFIEKEEYQKAVGQYSAAIQKAKNCHVLYLNRATALMKRKWYGDTYAAVRDCHIALKLDPTYIKAHFRLTRALLDLQQLDDAQACLDELLIRFPSHTNNKNVLMLQKDINVAIETNRQQERGMGDDVYSENELSWRQNSIDYEERFVGHCNTKTDIKEANFFGNDGKYIVAGSDDGNFFIWERATNSIVSVYQADESIVNCVQPHPLVCMLATSGIDHEIRLWTPQEQPKNRTKVDEIDKLIKENQDRMQADPFDLNGADPAVCRAS